MAHARPTLSSLTHQCGTLISSSDAQSPRPAPLTTADQVSVLLVAVFGDVLHRAHVQVAEQRQGAVVLTHLRYGNSMYFFRCFTVRPACRHGASVAVSQLILNVSIGIQSRMISEYYASKKMVGVRSHINYINVFHTLSLRPATTRYRGMGCAPALKHLVAAPKPGGMRNDGRCKGK